MSITEISPSAVKIDRLLHRMEDGDIKIPAFQRGFVWKQNQVIDLLDSIYNNYPIGSILLWNSNDRLKASRNIGGFKIPARPEGYPVNYVLDGQQRLSALYGLFCKERVLDDSSEKYSVDPVLFEIFFDVAERRFVPQAELSLLNHSLPLSCLFDIQKFMAAIQDFAPEEKEVAQALLSQFQNYELPVVTTNKRSKEEVGTIFERINNTGTRLTTFDLMIAWTWSEDFHLREEIDKILDTLTEKGFPEIDDKIVLQCLCAIAKHTTKTKDILALTSDQVRANTSFLAESLEKVVDYFSTQFNMQSSDFLPQSHQLIPFAYFFANTHIPDLKQSKLLRSWFWRTCFSLRYAGAVDTRLNQDLDFFDSILQGNGAGIEKYSYIPAEKTLIETPFTRTNVYTRAFLLLLSQSKPLDLTSGNVVDLGTALSKYNAKEYHHIFPKAFLESRSIAKEKINSLCNFCFLPSDSNKRISRRSPADYVFNLIPSAKRDEILRANLMPLDLELYRNEDYDGFLKNRATLITEQLRRAVEAQ